MCKEKVKVTLSIDKKTVENADKLFNYLGLDLDTATQVFYRASLRYLGIPFEIKADANYLEDIIYEQGDSYDDNCGYEENSSCNNGGFRY